MTAFRVHFALDGETQEPCLVAAGSPQEAGAELRRRHPGQVLAIAKIKIDRETPRPIRNARRKARTRADGAMSTGATA